MGNPPVHRARKRFGQNFLHDQSVIRNIIAAINPLPGQHIIEIGPGKGALTGPLLEHVAHLDVIEIDRDLVSSLNEQFNQPSERITIHSRDALTFDFSSFDHKDLRIIGNLPYNISTPLLFHLTSYAQYIQDMTFMLQKEVVDRMSAAPGNKTYGRLSVMMQYACEVKPLFIVKPGSFLPAPKVDSAVVQLLPRKEPAYPVHDMDVFSALVRDAFSQRRKTIRNALKNYVNDEQFTELNIDPTIRPEKLSIETFATLANHYYKNQNNEL